MKTKDILSEGTIEDLLNGKSRPVTIGGKSVGIRDDRKVIKRLPDGGSLIKFLVPQWYTLRSSEDKLWQVQFEKGSLLYLNSKNQHHRTDGPAVLHADGAQEWYANGQLHREDGPAVIYADGTMYWYNTGKLHREDGPAVINPNGYVAWYNNGKRLHHPLPLV